MIFDVRLADIVDWYGQSNWMCPMTTVGALEAKTQLPRLLERVEAGETIIITRDGHPVAHLVPPPGKPINPQMPALIERWIEARKGVTLGGLRVRDLIDEGRR
jgi:prevent-host-death family protein